uniref:Uncharacterized protein n=1 Tax=Rhizophora mucronata TaxID=61149 RepID=A0A2P2MG46_RHIMU
MAESLQTTPQDSTSTNDQKTNPRMDLGLKLTWRNLGGFKNSDHNQKAIRSIRTVHLTEPRRHILYVCIKPWQKKNIVSKPIRHANSDSDHPGSAIPSPVSP